MMPEVIFDISLTDPKIHGGHPKINMHLAWLQRSVGTTYQVDGCYSLGVMAPKVNFDILALSNSKSVTFRFHVESSKIKGYLL